MNPLLTVRNLHVYFNTFSGTIQAVRGANFSINKGEIVGLVGESGCGKSVTAHSILRLIEKDCEIKAGEVFFEELNLLTQSQKAMEKIRGKKIGMIFQDPYSSLNPTMRIGDQILEVLRKHEKISKVDAKKKVLSLLQQVGIGEAEDRVNQYPHEFSGGMCQRVLIAIAIACEPDLIIADEPTTALDVTIQAQILKLLKEIRQKKQASFLFISHDLGVVASICDRILVMYGGQIIESGTVDQLFLNPQHPYTQALLQSKFSLSLNNNVPALTIQGSPPLLINPPTRCSFMPRCPHAMKICTLQEPSLDKVNPFQHVACWLQKKKASSL